MLNVFSADAAAPYSERIQQPRASSSNDVFRGTSSASAAFLSPRDEKQPSDWRYHHHYHHQQQQQQQQAPQISPRPQKPLSVPPSPRLQQSDAATIGIDLR
jgi:hypothetical protein